MNEAQNPLAQLRDIHAPESVSWWPLAPGWWLMLIAILAIIFVILWRYSQRKNRAVQHAALKSLNQLDKRFHTDHDIKTLLTELSILLRRVAIASFPPHRVAGLTGAAWLRFLDETGGKGQFSSPLGLQFITLPYNLELEANGEQLIVLARNWIKRAPVYARKKDVL